MTCVDVAVPVAVVVELVVAVEGSVGLGSVVYCGAGIKGGSEGMELDLDLEDVAVDEVAAIVLKLIKNWMIESSSMLIYLFSGCHMVPSRFY